jgi:hypothetical protein
VFSVHWQCGGVANFDHPDWRTRDAFLRSHYRKMLPLASRISAPLAGQRAANDSRKPNPMRQRPMSARIAPRRRPVCPAR